MVLRALSFDETGTFVGPPRAISGERVFDDDRIPGNPEREVRGVDDAHLIDAAYVLAATCDAPPATGRERLRALAFVQRVVGGVFGGRARQDLAAALVAARAVILYPMLMLSVERMGIDTARVYASLARAASRLERIRQPLQLRNALLAVPGAVALVERARLAGAWDRTSRARRCWRWPRRLLRAGGSSAARSACGSSTTCCPAWASGSRPRSTRTPWTQQLLAALAGSADAERPVHRVGRTDVRVRPAARRSSSVTSRPATGWEATVWMPCSRFRRQRGQWRAVPLPTRRRWSSSWSGRWPASRRRASASTCRIRGA